MVDSNSRYSDGIYGQSLNSDGKTYDVYVFRSFYSRGTWNYVNYVFADGDRVDILADVFLGASNRWHEIMDINPELPDPLNIKPGTIVRIPR